MEPLCYIVRYMSIILYIKYHLCYILYFVCNTAYPTLVLYYIKMRTYNILNTIRVILYAIL